MKRFTKAIIAIMLMMTGCIVAGCTKPDNPTNGGNNNGGNGNNSISGHEYVDLGLPSGTLWATCNVGANAPEEYGDYFTWGEVRPKTVYNWSTYQHCYGSVTTLIKYCCHDIFGYNYFTDGLKILLSEDDAATANWGNDWRMPTKEEWEELKNNSTIIWTTRNGVNGWRFTAMNGNMLFLPAAGYRDDSNLEIVGSFGVYWSSSLHDAYTGSAWYFKLHSVSCIIEYHVRCSGLPVRPVCSECKN